MFHVFNGAILPKGNSSWGKKQMYSSSSQYTTQVRSLNFPDTLSKEVGVWTGHFSLSDNQLADKMSLLQSLCSLFSKEGYDNNDSFVEVINPLLDPRSMFSHITFVVFPLVRLFPVVIHFM